MKAIIVSTVCRLLAYISVLAFVFGLVVWSGSYKFLWFLLLLLTCGLVPTYESRINNDNNS